MLTLYSILLRVGLHIVSISTWLESFHNLRKAPDGSTSTLYNAAGPAELLSNQSTNLTHDRAEINIGDRNTTVVIDNRVACLSDQFYRDHGNMNNSTSSISKLCFLLFHLAVLGYLGLELDYFSVSSLVLLLLGTVLTACNYWLWLCPMDRVRDVSHPA